MAIRGFFRLVSGNMRVAALSALALSGVPAFAQYQITPVYLDDSPSAEEAIARARVLAGNQILDEAARVLQKVLDEHGDQVAATPDDPELFTPVRDQVFGALRSNPALLERYVAITEPRASALLRLGDADEVERSMLLTPSGLEAALRVAQRQMESAAFDGAALTLESVRNHPALDADSARSAAHLALQVWSYLPEGSPNGAILVDCVRAWRAISGDADAGFPQRAKRPDMIESRSPYTPLAAPSLEGVLSKPLASERLGETPEAVRRIASENSNRSLPDSARVLNAMPAIAGDMVLTNDSESVTAFDRFTLNRRWRVTLVAPIVLGSQRYQGLEDPNMVVVSDPYAVALTGVTMVSKSSRERLLAAIDIRTGELAWRTSLTELTIPELRDGLMRGPVTVGDGVVVVSVVRSVSEHRLMSVSLAGFDLATGKLRWHRPIGSIGYVTWALNPDVIDASASMGGIVYRGDRIGVVSAVEAATGRVRWIRRMSRSFDPQGLEAEPWEGNSPVMVGGRLYTLSPDRQRIVEIEPSTGRIVSTVQSIDFGSPMYLVKMGDLLAGVSRLMATAKPIDRFADPTVRPSVIGDFSQGGIRGRVMNAGDALVFPTPSGITVIRGTAQPDGAVQAARTNLALDAAGNAMIAPGQVVIADDDRVHSYLSWDAASELLRDRMDSTPDPEPAVTYAELAYRAAQDLEVVTSVDTAIERIEADPLAESNEAARTRLFNSVMEMIEPRTPRQLGGALADGPRGALVQRVMKIASSPEERVGALLAAGRLHESQGSPALAVERYQEILSSSVLAEAAFSGGSTRVPAEVEAVRRLRRVVGIEGRSVYAAYDAELDRLLVERASSRDAKEFAELARRYPVALHASSAWLEAARRWRAASDQREAIRALEEGLAAARETMPPSDPVFGEIAGTLVETLVDVGRYIPAAHLLDDLRGAGGSVRLTMDGSPIDGASLHARIMTELASRSRLPRIGTEFPRVTLMEGYALADVSDDRPDSMPADTVVLESEDGTRSAWRADPAGGLEKIWVTDVTGDVVRVDHDAVYFSDVRSSRVAERTITRVSMATGATEWTSPPFSSMFSERDPFENTPGGPPRVDTPLQRSAPLTDLFAAFEPDTLVLVERTGRTAAIDLATGRLLWSTELSRARVNTVHDVSSGDGLVVIGGMRLLPPAAGAGLGRGSVDVVVVLDARTGEIAFEYEESSPIRWVRVGIDGRVLVGFESGVSCLDAARRTVVWRNDRPTVAETMEGWSVASGVIVRDFENSLYWIDPRDGTVNDTPLPVGDRLDSGANIVELTPVENGGLMIGTNRGVALVDRDRALAGIDSGGYGQQVLSPELGEGMVVTVSLDGNPVSDGISSYRINVYDTASVKALRPTTGVQLGVMPRALRVIDDRIIVGAGNVVAVIDAPASPPAPAPSAPMAPPVPVPRETPPSPSGDGVDSPG